MAASSRAEVLRLYRALLRESQRFGGYNYRTYAIRRIRDAFRENKNIKDSEKIEELVNKAKVNLEVIHRQAECPSLWLHDILRCQKTDSLLSYDIPIFSILVRLVDQIMESQVTIGQLYSTQKLVIESPGNT
ncbi:PREDICTED: LYR motif-containing protein 4 isoform X1 [Haliaeetus leucocephalus]|uniref:LYR motif-containing protein 4 isoform X1 n=1 Tax=Haliaeetus leucocephalus TaxID=52644 RepID=UPI00053CDD6E|nr:PREDICTED: LYR motif-containing protein 4 isoform X1 [Haliaeetus leucocephalus]